MRLRTLILRVFVVVLLMLWRPKQILAEFRRIQSQWDTILRLLVIVIIGYMLYGVYQVWSGNVSWWPY
ncbi:MAG: hypothetical protein R2856_00975 [Caldilineaceae bacterium]